MTEEESQRADDRGAEDQHGGRVEPEAPAGELPQRHHDAARQEETPEIADLGARGGSLQQGHPQTLRHGGGKKDPLDPVDDE